MSLEKLSSWCVFRERWGAWRGKYKQIHGASISSSPMAARELPDSPCRCGEIAAVACQAPMLPPSDRFRISSEAKNPGHWLGDRAIHSWTICGTEVTGSTGHLFLLLPPSCPPVQCLFGFKGCGESEAGSTQGARVEQVWAAGQSSCGAGR